MVKMGMARLMGRRESWTERGTMYGVILSREGR